MPNAIKYSTSSQTKALKRGNFWLGTEGIERGPTSVTGYRKGITPPAEGYTIYLNSGAGPQIYCPPNDAKLIEMTNMISGNSYADVPQCLSYFASQSDKMCLNKDYPNIVTDGLVYDLNSTITISYPRSGSTWYDASPSSSDAALSNVPGFDPDSDTIVFDGASDYADITVPGLTTIATVEMIAKIGPAYVNKMMFGWPIYDVYCYNGGLGFNTGNGDVYGISDSAANNLGIPNNWKHYVFEMRSDVSYDSNKIYVNGASQPLSQQLGSEYPPYRNFGGGQGRIACWANDLNYLMQMQCALFRVYNRSLTQEEINQNYYQGNIVTDGLVMALDASNQVSYPGINPFWYDMTSNGFNTTLMNGPGFKSANGGAISFDGIDDYVSVAIDLAFETPSVTYEAWVKLLDRGNRHIVYVNWQGNSLEVNADRSVVMYNFGSSGQLGAATTGNQFSWGEWVHIVGTYEVATQTLNTYVNGTLKATRPSTPSTLYSTSVHKISGTDYGGAIKGDVAIVRHYNRALSSNEVLQNYNAQKSRFGRR